MKDIIIVPTYDRPEYLWVCLEKLKEAHLIDGKEIWICEDQHADAPKHFTTQIEMLAVLREANRIFDKNRLVYIGREPHAYYGNSYNVLEALRLADKQDDVRYIYIVEDDTMVMPDFFEWNEKAQEQFQPFATCAGRINRSLNFQMNGPEAIDESYKDSMACVRSGKAYMSWATCFRKSSMRTVLGPFETYEEGYKLFVPGFEQDIMIQMNMSANYQQTVWPYVPRAYHMGWYSYHRTAGMKFNGTLEEKVTALRKAISDKAKIKDMAGLQDIDPYPKEQVRWGEFDFYLKADYR